MSPRLRYGIAFLVLLTSCGLIERPAREPRRLPGSSSSEPRYDVTCLQEIHCERSMRHQCPKGYQVHGVDKRRDGNGTPREDPPSIQQPYEPPANRQLDWDIASFRYVFACL